MNSNSTTKLKNYDGGGGNNAAFDFVASPGFKTLAAGATDMFSNVNSADCGAFTTCYPKPQGCSGTYTGRAKVEAGTLALKVEQSAKQGYNETLCIVCENAAGSKTQHDNFSI